MFYISDMKPKTAAIDLAKEHFTSLGATDKHNNVHVRCKYCNREFRCSRQRLVSHLAALSGNGIKPCLMVPRTIRQELRAMVSTEPRAESERVLVSVISDDEPSGVGEDVIDLEAAPPRPPKQRKIEDCVRGAETEAAHRAWARFIFAEGLPLRAIESPFFKEALKASAGIPGYLPPGRKILSNRLLDSEYDSLRRDARNAIAPEIAKTGESDCSISQTLCSEP